EQEIFTYINRQKQAHKTIMISQLLEYFSIRPYGWYQNAILALLASMYMKQKIDLKQNSTSLGKQEVGVALQNNRQFNTIVVPKENVDPLKIKKAKELLSELYPLVSFNSTSTRDIFSQAMEQTKELINSAKNYKNLGYPFNSSFDEIIETLTPLSKLTEDSLFNEITTMEDKLLDCKEELIDPIIEFMNGEKRKIYDNVRAFLTSNKDNLRYIEDDAKKVLEELLTLPKPFAGAKIQQAKQALITVESLLAPLIEQSKNEAKDKINELVKELQSNENFHKVPEADRFKIIKPRLALIDSLEHTTSIDAIKQRVSSESLQSESQNALELIYELIPVEKKDDIVELKTVKISSITPKTKRALNDKNDVEEYITTLKQKLLDEINDGKQILL
ncbi:MAG: hypothetical protein L0Y61_09105, partial [Epsilonproteobacteria bacterium]|nr:hypothetical protein [Campylobacterota bacterium]